MYVEGSKIRCYMYPSQKYSFHLYPDQNQPEKTWSARSLLMAIVIFSPAENLKLLRTWIEKLTSMMMTVEMGRGGMLTLIQDSPGHYIFSFYFLTFLSMIYPPLQVRSQRIRALHWYKLRTPQRPPVIDCVIKISMAVDLDWTRHCD